MSKTPPRIGVIGMGLMGTPMSQRILDAGFSLNVWNRTIEKCQSLPQANVVPSAAQLVQESDIVCLCVSDTEAVEALVFGESGIAAQLRSEQIVIDFSSIDPAATRHIAQQVHTGSGAQWLDAPVSGGVIGATNGTLAIMVGGNSTALEQAHPLLNVLSQRVTHMGPVGSGQTTKVCNQMLVSCNLLAMAEVLALAEQSGVDACRLPGALQGGFADSIPLQITGQRMANQDFDDIKWRVRTLLKDLDLAANLSDNSESKTPLTALTQSLLRRHADAGYGDADPATLIKLYDRPDQ
jgi:3-hydroxyisobutyrate dehydrogenase